MGFLGQASTGRQFPLTVLLPGYQVQCNFHATGIIQTFLNDEQKETFVLHDASVFGLEPGSPATSMMLPEMFVRKDHCHALAFESMLDRDDTGLMPRTENLAVYTSHYCIQADFHMGSDALLADFISGSKIMFIGATNATFFPLFRTQVAIIQQAPLVFIHRDTVRMHHRM